MSARCSFARDLIELLSADSSENYEKAWLEEAEHRYGAYANGEIKACYAEQFIAELKDRYN
jgi:hypothetical protein